MCDASIETKALETEITRRALLVGALTASAAAALAGPGRRASASDQDELLEGVIDFHVHSDPERTDFFARSVDDFQVSENMADAGARAIVLKNHYLITSDRAFLARRVVGDIDVFGGIALNQPVGGLNVTAIQTMARMKGGFGKVVWFPTFDSQQHVTVRFPAKRPFVRVVEPFPNGDLLPEAVECLKAVRDEGPVLESGHLSAPEALTLFRKARDLGINKMVVTHGLMDPARFTIDQMREVAGLGAFIEHAFLGTIVGPDSPVPGLRDWTRIPISAYAEATRAVGAEHFILSSDLGQLGNPLHQVGYRTFIMELMAAGITAEEIDLIARKNPARLLSLS